MLKTLLYNIKWRWGEMPLEDGGGGEAHLAIPDTNNEKHRLSHTHAAPPHPFAHTHMKRARNKTETNCPVGVSRANNSPQPPMYAIFAHKQIPHETHHGAPHRAKPAFWGYLPTSDKKRSSHNTTHHCMFKLEQYYQKGDSTITWCW